MKKLFTLFVMIALTISVFAQSPQKMSYQAVIRNSSGALVTNHAVGMRISILQGSATGTVVYRETYSPVPQTNANGLVTVEIGSGIPSTGTFPGINWGAGPYYIKTETDPNGGTSYTITGTSQLVSVPLSLYSETAGELTLPFSANTTSRDPVLEIKNNYYAGQDNPYRVGIKGISDAPYGIGVYGEALTEAGGYSKGVYGIVKSNVGVGVFGENTNLTGPSACGIHGESHSTSGKGVNGLASATSGSNYGGYFESKSTSGYGVIGHSQKFAVYGESSGTKSRAVTGEATGTESIGVRGIALKENSTGVWGEGSNYDFYANGPGTNYGSPSSIRWKENIAVINNPLEMIKEIRGVYFDWNAEHGGIHDIGFIAEEVGKIVPEIVVYEENGVDASGLDYSKITPLLLEAIKEQQLQIDELKALVNTLIANQTGQDDN